MEDYKDDRTPEQRESHRWLVVGTDSFTSGWGPCEGGLSNAAWACTPKTVDAVEARILDRSEMKRVRVIHEGPRRYRPRGAAHLHIYVAKEAT